MIGTIRAHRIVLAGCVGLVVAAAVGCNPPPQRLNAPPQGWSSRRSDLQENFVYMQDNQMLSDMHVSDVHFYPHRGALNSLGARRLDRYASLLRDLGGTIRYDTEMAESDPLVAERLTAIRSYLAAAGADMSRVSVEYGPQPEADMTAEEAILARKSLMATGQPPQDKAKQGSDQTQESSQDQ